MRLVPSAVLACPHCASQAVDRIAASSNTLGGSWWSDGVFRGPMWPTTADVAQCSACGALLRRQALIHTGLDPQAFLARTAISRGGGFVLPAAHRIWAALDQGFAADAAELRQLQLLAWRRANDVLCWQAVPPEAALPASRAASTPPHRLRLINASLAGDRDEDLLLKAEVLRHLSRFDEALDTLARVSSQAPLDWCQQLQALCGARQTHLARMPAAPVGTQPFGSA